MVFEYLQNIFRDMFVLDKDGYGSFLGRLDDCIIRGGENIAPKEIEDVINTHPDVLESFVVGVPDKRLGMNVCAFVRKSAKCDFQENDLKKFCKGKIAYFKIPKYVHFLSEDDIPKTSSGKIPKKRLRDIFVKRTMDFVMD